jgi:hypothetical protein
MRKYFVLAVMSVITVAGQQRAAVTYTVERSVIPFKNLVGNPRVWHETAHDLISSANLLLEAGQGREGGKTNPEARRPIVWRTLMMLYGLAAENLIKGIIVARQPLLASQGKVPRWFTKHNLAALARRADLPVPVSQEHLLKRLQQFAECGKYRVGRREGEGRSTWVFSEPLDSSDTVQLLQYLEKELEQASSGFVVASPGLRGIHGR